MGLLLDSWLQEGALVFAAALVAIAYLFNRSLKAMDWSNFKRPPTLTQLRLDLKMLTLKVSFIDYLDVIYKMFPGEKAVSYLQLMVPTVLLRDPAVVEKVLVKDFGYFHDHGTDVDFEVNPLEGHLFNMSGAKWRALRARLSPVFSSGKLKNMFQQVVDTADKMATVVPRGEEFLVRDYLSRFAIDVIGSTAFGVEAGALENPDSEFRKMALKIFRPSKKQVFRAFFRSFLPKIFKALKMKTLDDEVTNFFFSITKQAFEHRAKTGTTRGDIVDLFLQLKGKGKIDVEAHGKQKEDSKEDSDEASQLVLTDELLTAQSFIFLAAGWETVATAMSYTTYFLAKHQDIQERLREEVRSLENFDYDSVRSMKYLEACIFEAMRMFAPAQALIRSCTRSYVMTDDVTGCPIGRVKKGTLVIIPAASIHMDPANFPSPETYNPGRFLGETPPRPGSFMPFGDGPRVCIAQRFAMMEVKVIVAKLVSKFKIDLSPRTVEPIQIDHANFVNDVKGGLWIRLEDLTS